MSQQCKKEFEGRLRGLKNAPTTYAPVKKDLAGESTTTIPTGKGVIVDGNSTFTYDIVEGIELTRTSWKPPQPA